jgi:hypothetical protein
MPEVNPAQACVRFINGANVICYQNESLGSWDEHRRPTCKGAYETYLYRIPEMKRSKLLGSSYVKHESTISQLFSELGACQRLKL